MAKFRVKPFKLWLHHIAAVAIKTRDAFTCQWQEADGCLGAMQPLDENCHSHHAVGKRNVNITAWDPLNLITLCKRCHSRADAMPTEFGVWFGENYRNRYDHCRELLTLPMKTWRQEDFEREEELLIAYCHDINVDWLNVNKKYRDRFRRKIKAYREINDK